MNKAIYKDFRVQALTCILKQVKKRINGEHMKEKFINYKVKVR